MVFEIKNNLRRWPFCLPNVFSKSRKFRPFWSNSQTRQYQQSKRVKEMSIVIKCVICSSTILIFITQTTANIRVSNKFLTKFYQATVFLKEPTRDIIITRNPGFLYRGPDRNL